MSRANVVPLPIEPKPFVFTGALRKIAPREKLPLRWPSRRKQQYELFDAWQDVARQVVAREKLDRSLADKIREVVFWKTGEITAKNDRLARLCGCSVKTITRHLNHYANLGLIEITYGVTRREGEQFKKTRTITLTIPKDISWVVLADNPSDPDIITTSHRQSNDPEDLEFDSDLASPPF